MADYFEAKRRIDWHSGGRASRGGRLAGALLLLLTLAALPLPAQAEATFELASGQRVKGQILRLTSNTLVLRVPEGGMLSMPRNALSLVELDAPGQGRVRGQLADWRDGTYVLRVAGDLVSFKDRAVRPAVAKDPPAAPPAPAREAPPPAPAATAAVVAAVPPVPAAKPAAPPAEPPSPVAKAAAATLPDVPPEDGSAEALRDELRRFLAEQPEVARQGKDAVFEAFFKHLMRTEGAAPP